MESMILSEFLKDDKKNFNFDNIQKSSLFFM